MNEYNYLAVDTCTKMLACAHGINSEYQIPNSLALFEEEYYEKPYDDEDIIFEDYLIVEIKSPAI